MITLETFTHYYTAASAPMTQLIVCGICFAIALGIRFLLASNKLIKSKIAKQISSYLLPLIAPAIFLGLLSFVHSFFTSPMLVGLCTKVSIIWFLISMFHGPMKKSIVSWVIAAFVVPAVALDILGLFDSLKAYMQGVGLSFGPVKITAYQIPEFILSLSIMLWVATSIAHAIENYLNRQKAMAFGTRRIIVKVINILIYFTVFITALTMLGIDLTMFAVFSGAIGVGIGLGLQRTASNFISGMVMLGENTLKEGDLIEVSTGITGYVRKIGGRTTIIEQLDGKETAVPNDQLMTNILTSYTLNNSRGRIEINLSVAYGSDLEKVQNILLEEATRHPRCLKKPEAECFLKSFGTSGVDFVLFFWVEDVTAGVFAPKSDVQMGIWKRFKKEGIALALPQHEVLLKNAPAKA